MHATDSRVLVLCAPDAVDRGVARRLAETEIESVFLSSAPPDVGTEHVYVDDRDVRQVLDVAERTAAELSPTHLIARASDASGAVGASRAFLVAARRHLARRAAPVLQTVLLPESEDAVEHCDWLAQMFAWGQGSPGCSVIRHRPLDPPFTDCRGERHDTSAGRRPVSATLLASLISTHVFAALPGVLAESPTR